MGQLKMHTATQFQKADGSRLYCVKRLSPALTKRCVRTAVDDRQACSPRLRPLRAATAPDVSNGSYYGYGQEYPDTAGPDNFSALAWPPPCDVPGARIEPVTPQPAEALPFLLYLPDIDGAGVTSCRQWEEWSASFDMHAVFLDPECTCSFAELAAGIRRWLTCALAGVPPQRPVYLLGEGFGGVLALQLAWDCRRLVNRLILVNPATSYADSQLARLTPLLERLPPALLNAQLPPPPALPQLPQFPQLPQLPPLLLPSSGPLALPLALAPVLGTSPRALLRQLAGSISAQQPAEAVQALRRALEQVELLSSRLPPAAFLHRLRMLQQGIKSVSPRLPYIPQRTLLLAGGGDVLLDSEREARRLEGTLQRAFRKVLPECGHALLHEPGGALLPLLAAEGFYLTARRFSSPLPAGADGNCFGSAGPVEVPNEQEIRRYAAAWTSRLRQLNSPVFLSTRADGSRQLGLGGLPDWRGRPQRLGWEGGQQQAEGWGGAGASDDGGGEALGDGPLLFVGNHQLYAFDMSVMVEEVLTQRGILMRGLAHPGLFRQPAPEGEGEGEGAEGAEPQARRPEASSSSSSSGGNRGSNSSPSSTGGRREGEEMLPPAFMGNMFQSFGAVRVTPTALYRLLAAGEAVLLYPGGVREGFKRRNEKYELFWPARSEFVRMAARFGATIIPVSAVGLEDSLQIVMDADDIRRSPMWSARAQEQVAAAPRARVGVSADSALDESFIPPLIAPSVPSRFYFLFGRPLRTSPHMYRDKAACDQLYQAVRAEVEGGISYLLRKREQDPHRDFLRRLVYEQNPPFGPRRVAPTFKP
ncbi:hypothetical protein Agub_g11162 [Astrephomene gubernaculifera]|uniref:Serine aminopeptidase S33 domain-containing protein n=1 Tax=Astrephomene gubernaculifera TaxID=47775 RepID=A0AAD3HPL4_9CHLO|nr:hypothetical protein Agub_g11162 [Astrephomene gubernaculifera]